MDQAWRGLPAHRAPLSLESSVLREIERLGRGAVVAENLCALAPSRARCAFILVCASLIGLMFLLAGWRRVPSSPGTVRWHCDFLGAPRGGHRDGGGRHLRTARKLDSPFMVDIRAGRRHGSLYGFIRAGRRSVQNALPFAPSSAGDISMNYLRVARIALLHSWSVTRARRAHSPRAQSTAPRAAAAGSSRFRGSGFGPCRPAAPPADLRSLPTMTAGIAGTTSTIMHGIRMRPRHASTAMRSSISAMIPELQSRRHADSVVSDFRLLEQRGRCGRRGVPCSAGTRITGRSARRGGRSRRVCTSTARWTAT